MKPLIVTGIHRSGKSSLSRAFLKSGYFWYVHELMNPSKRNVFKLNKSVDKSYLKIDKSNQHKFLSDISSVLTSRRTLLKYHFKYFGKRGKVKFRDIRYLAFGKTPLWDDPFLALSTDWLKDHFDLHIILVVRHPAHFVKSLKLLNWHYPVEHLLDQQNLLPLLTDHQLRLLKEMKSTDNVVERGAVLWNILYGCNHSQVSTENITLVKFEDLMNDPNRVAASLFKKLYGFDVKLPDVSDQMGFRKRDSEFKAWKKMGEATLSPDELRRIKYLTSNVWSLYYDEDTWDQLTN